MKLFLIVLIAGGMTASGCGSAPSRLEFSRDAGPETFVWSDTGAPYLVRLRTEHKLDALVLPSDTDYQKIQKMTAWVNGLWRHNGWNEPSKSDPITILQEVKKGKRFRCVEYSVVLAGALNSLGIKARVLSIRTQDMETRRSGAGHVVVEAYLKDEGRWIMADGQFGVIPTLDGRPLDAVELQDALARKAPGLSVFSAAGEPAQGWFNWVAPYLYHFTVRFDDRFDDPMPSSRSLMLLPIGAQEPKIFQRRDPITDTTYTHAIAAFYPKI